MAAIANGIWLQHTGLPGDPWGEPARPQNGIIRTPERPGHWRLRLSQWPVRR